MSDSEVDIITVIQKLLEGVEYIKPSEDTEVLIFIGKTQVGKSTTINACNFIPIKKNQKSGTIEIDQSKLPAGCVTAGIGDGKISKTKFPGLYKNNNPNSEFGKFEFLDTRGFCDTNRNINEDIAAGLLIDLALEKTDEVKIIFLANFDHYSKLLEFQECGIKLSQMLHGYKIPIYFLSSRANKIFKAKLSETDNGEDILKAHDLMKEELKSDMLSLCKTQEKALEKCLRDEKIIVERKNNTGKIPSEEFWRSVGDPLKYMESKSVNYKNNAKNTKFTEYLKFSAKNDYCGYIDPLKEESVKIFLRAIDEMPCINKKDVKLFLDYKTQVKEEILKYTNRMCDFLENLAKLHTCSIDNLKDIIEQLNTKNVEIEKEVENNEKEKKTQEDKKKEIQTEIDKLKRVISSLGGVLTMDIETAKKMYGMTIDSVEDKMKTIQSTIRNNNDHITRYRRSNDQIDCNLDEADRLITNIESEIEELEYGITKASSTTINRVRENYYKRIEPVEYEERHWVLFIPYWTTESYMDTRTAHSYTYRSRLPYRDVSTAVHSGRLGSVVEKTSTSYVRSTYCNYDGVIDIDFIFDVCEYDLPSNKEKRERNRRDIENRKKEMRRIEEKKRESDRMIKNNHYEINSLENRNRDLERELGDIRRKKEEINYEKEKFVDTSVLLTEKTKELADCDKAITGSDNNIVAKNKEKDENLEKIGKINNALENLNYYYDDKNGKNANIIDKLYDCVTKFRFLDEKNNFIVFYESIKESNNTKTVYDSDTLFKVIIWPLKECNFGEITDIIRQLDYIKPDSKDIDDEY